MQASLGFTKVVSANMFQNHNFVKIFTAKVLYYTVTDSFFIDLSQRISPMYPSCIYISQGLSNYINVLGCHNLDKSFAYTQTT